tara:strand:+ start:531 stop:1154 length:624 start_codon:yes stop_codon:yes gene_type:complete
MNTFETYLLTFVIITLVIVVGLPFLCSGCRMSMLYWDYGSEDTSTAHRLMLLGCVSLLAITCLILFYYGTDDYRDEVTELEHYYGFILGSTNVWVGLAYLLAYMYKKGYKNNAKWGWLWNFLLACAFACLIVTCVFSVKLNNYVKDLTNKHGKDKKGDEAVWWIMRVFSIIFVVWVCVFHTGLWLYHRFYWKGNFRRKTEINVINTG